MPFTWTNIDITNILYFSQILSNIWRFQPKLNVWDSHCIRLDVISIYPWNFYTQELGNNQHADVIWGEIIFWTYAVWHNSLYLFKITCMNCHCTLYKRNLYQYIKKYEYLHVLPIFLNFVFMTKDQMTGGILFLSCLSVVNINIR